MKALTRAESRDVDRRAINDLGIPGIVLMENAGRGVVDVLLGSEPPPRSVLILCGKGNNGGDGFVVARHLMIHHIAASVVLFGPQAELEGDAWTNFHILEQLQIPIVDLAQEGNLPVALDENFIGADWVVDAMLGTGAVGVPREPYASAIEWLNRQSVRKLAIDVPSGFDCDTGKPAAVTVRADVTCTFHAPKTGFLAPAAREFLGELHVISIGIPTDFAVW